MVQKTANRPRDANGRLKKMLTMERMVETLREAGGGPSVTAELAEILDMDPRTIRAAYSKIVNMPWETPIKGRKSGGVWVFWLEDEEGVEEESVYTLDFRLRTTIQEMASIMEYVLKWKPHHNIFQLKNEEGGLSDPLDESNILNILNDYADHSGVSRFTQLKLSKPKLNLLSAACDKRYEQNPQSVHSEWVRDRDKLLLLMVYKSGPNDLVNIIQSYKYEVHHDESEMIFYRDVVADKPGFHNRYKDGMQLICNVCGHKFKKDDICHSIDRMKMANKEEGEIDAILQVCEKCLPKILKNASWDLV